MRESEPMVTVPSVAVWEKRLVDEATVEKRVVVVALVEVAFTVTRLVMVELALFTKMPSPAWSGER